LGLLAFGFFMDLGDAIEGEVALGGGDVGGVDGGLKLDEGEHAFAGLGVGLAEVDAVAGGGLALGVGEIDEVLEGGDLAVVGVGLVGEGGVEEEHGGVVGMLRDDLVGDVEGFVKAACAEEDLGLGGEGGGEARVEGQGAVQGGEGVGPVGDLAIVEGEGGPIVGEGACVWLGGIEGAAGHLELADGDEAGGGACEEAGLVFAMELGGGDVEISFRPVLGTGAAEDEVSVIEPCEDEVLVVGEGLEEGLVGSGIAGEEDGVELALVIEGAEDGGQLDALCEGMLIGGGDEIRAGCEEIGVGAGREEEVMDVLEVCDGELLAGEAGIDRVMVRADEDDDAEHEVQQDEAGEGEEDGLLVLHSPSECMNGWDFQKGLVGKFFGGRQSALIVHFWGGFLTTDDTDLHG